MILLDGSNLTLDALERIVRDREAVGIAPDAAARVRASREVIVQHLERGTPVYGVNTGFGALADVAIPPDQLAALQLNLLRSHAAGVGEPLPVPAVRALMALRANVLAKGFSGIRLETLEALVALLNAGVHPRVPARGSVGASGDLAPLAHLSLVLVGEGEVLEEERPRGSPSTGRRLPTGVLPTPDVLTAAGLTPVILEPKEGIALINGTQASAAVLALACTAAQRLARVADIAAAMSIDALRGSIHPFEARLHAVRPVPGQVASAANLWALVEGSGLNQSHENCGKIQDAYALRCAPQVHGAAREALDFARRLVEIEANAATDNPMVFAETGEVVSGGNFHGAPVALASDTLAIGVAQLATISERRTDRLMTASESGLPPFLVRESGLHSGLMMAHVTAAALTAEIKTLAHPASVDTIPTSAGREDHVSMSMGAALKAAEIVERVRVVLAIELLAGCQALDLLAPLATSAALERVRAAIRKIVPTISVDRPPAPDIEKISEMIASGEIDRACGIDLR
ncbi:MAG TPA: histidine ammonia-lyase [Vicinamibacterales bacterium]|nr:histidine ammonia-lyase [Vicinamibacterales bacterium]